MLLPAMFGTWILGCVFLHAPSHDIPPHIAHGQKNSDELDTGASDWGRTDLWRAPPQLKVRAARPNAQQIQQARHVLIRVIDWYIQSGFVPACVLLLRVQVCCMCNSRVTNWWWGWCCCYWAVNSGTCWPPSTRTRGAPWRLTLGVGTRGSLQDVFHRVEAKKSCTCST